LRCLLQQCKPPPEPLPIFSAYLITNVSRTTEADTATIRAGDRQYVVDKTLLLEKLPNFEAHFADLLRDFSPEDAGALDLLIHWIQGDRSAFSKPLLESIQEYLEDTTPLGIFLELYGFAEQLSCTKLMDETMNAILPFYRTFRFATLDEIKSVYKITGPGSRLRELMAGLFAWRLLRAAKVEKVMGDRQRSHFYMVDTIKESNGAVIKEDEAWMADLKEELRQRELLRQEEHDNSAGEAAERLSDQNMLPERDSDQDDSGDVIESEESYDAGVSSGVRRQMHTWGGNMHSSMQKHHGIEPT
jgi:hypothetical protein